ncbi:MAG: hypothetical protein ABEI97_03155, partial [Candidatus Nanohaloarchaea archaeon]
AFTPVLSWHEQHYSRVVGRVEESKQQCNRMLDDIGFLSFCRSCRWREYTWVETCPECGSGVERAGPLWTGRLGTEDIGAAVTAWLEEQGYDAAAELVQTVADEVTVTTPFYDTHELASTLDVEAPSLDTVIDDLQDQRYTAVPTHFSPHGVKTDAPFTAVQDAVARR